jgi:hypothetical protein
MADDDLLYSYLVNKLKLKTLNGNLSVEVQPVSVANNLTSNVSSVSLNNEHAYNNHFMKEDILYEANQIFMEYCTSSMSVQNNISAFNDFMKVEMPSFICKFEKYSFGKND